MTRADPGSSDAPVAAPAPPLPRSFLVALVVGCLGGNLVAALGTPLIPTVARLYGVSLDAAQWTLTISLLVGVVVTPLVSRLADGGKRRRLLMITLAFICLGGVLAAVATSFPVLLVARALEGLGYAIIPLGIGIARQYLTGPRLTTALIALSLSLAVGSGIANPIIGGLVETAGYQYAFWFAAAVSGGSILWIRVAVPADQPGARRPGFDFPGAVLLSVTLAALMLGITKGESWGWTSPRVATLLIGGVLVAAVWVRLELRTAIPLIDLRLALHRAVLAANLSAVLFGMAMFMLTSLISRLVQTPTSIPYGLGGTALTSGTLLLVQALGSLAAQPITRIAARRLGLGAVLPLGGLLVCGGVLFMAVEHGSVLWLAAVMAFVGLGVGMTFAATPALIVANVPEDRAASATGLNTLIRLFGGAVGSALSAVILAINTPAGATYPDEHGYVVGCIVSAGFALAIVVSGVLLVRPGRAGAGPDRDQELI